jgi:hypothetical protein
MTSPSHGRLISQYGNVEAETSTSPPETGRITVQKTAGQYIAEELARHRAHLTRIERQAFNKTHPVDEYISTPGVPAAGSVTAAWPFTVTASVELQPTWQMPERIDAYLVCLPVGTTLAVMALGDRYIVIYSGSALTAVTTYSYQGLGIILTEDDNRVLLLAGTLTAGPTHFELMGYADEVWGNA